MNDFEKAMRFRHACKVFDENRKIPDSEMDWILDMGRISPSSFGLEPWHFLVIKEARLKDEMRIACWDQPQVTTCSHFVVILVRQPKYFKHDSEYLDHSFKRRVGDDPERLEKIKEVFTDFEKYDLRPELEDWTKMQAYLASANMMTAAAFIGVDSCPIEGFSYGELERILENEVEMFDAKDFGIAYCVAFGYRAKPQGEQIRWAREEVITYI